MTTRPSNYILDQWYTTQTPRPAVVSRPLRWPDSSCAARRRVHCFVRYVKPQHTRGSQFACAGESAVNPWYSDAVGQRDPLGGCHPWIHQFNLAAPSGTGRVPPAVIGPVQR